VSESDEFADGEPTRPDASGPPEHLMNMLADCRYGHAELKANEHAWAAATLTGYGGCDGELYEHRECPWCGVVVSKQVML
jgi:hypothetical protein